jgi:glucose-1-phosphate thymidylyltransferase
MTDLKIIIPMAGVGRRFGELTRRRPKALVRLADGRLLDHVLARFHALEAAYAVQYIFVIGYLGEQIREYASKSYPDRSISYYVQEELKGQSHAVYLAKDAISGPTLLTYCDTINETDFSFLSLAAGDGIASVQEVEDPERFGVAITSSDNLITKLVEKPRTTEHKMALTGLYYLPEGKGLVRAIEAQMQQGKSVNNEYYLADAINLMIDHGMRIRAEKVSRWLDAGTPEALLQANACLLQASNAQAAQIEVKQSNVLRHPVYLSQSARVQNSILGPNVSIGENCFIEGCILRNTIVDDDSTITSATLADSLIGKGCSVSGDPLRSIVGDHSEIRCN